MAKVLYVDDMLDLAFELFEPEEHARILAQHEAAAQKLADRIAEKLGVVAGVFTFDMGHLGGPFLPAENGQECPELIEEKDPGGDWEMT